MSPLGSAFAAVFFGGVNWLSGDESAIVRLVCWVASAACLAHAANKCFGMLERPVRDNDVFDQYKKIGSGRRLGKCEIEFPWNDRKDATTNQDGSLICFLGSCLSSFVSSEWLSYFDSETRREGKWDIERRKWRGLQQQLSILRSVRTRRRIAEGQCTDEGTSSDRVEGKFPWKSNSNSSLLGSLKELLQQSYENGWVKWNVNSEHRHRLKWDEERRRWRDLQQQLGDLRIIRSSRKASGTQWKSQADGIEVMVNSENRFPWQEEEVSSNCGALEWLLSSPSVADLRLVGVAQWFFTSESQRTIKWDVERRRWRELQQQLGTLRAIRATRQAAGTKWKSQTDDLETVDTTQTFPWNEESSTNCGGVEWCLSCLLTCNMGYTSFIRWIFEADYRRTVKWDEERRRWRDLQQQLGALRVIRATRQAAGTEWKSQTDDLQPVGATQTFPWNEVSSTNCGAAEWCLPCLLPCNMGYSSFIRWIFEADYRRKVKWDEERRRWRDLQQQLGALRVIRVSREEAGSHWKSQANDIEITSTKQSFPWKEESSGPGWLQVFSAL